MSEEAVPGDIITTARHRQGDVEIKSSPRGGISFKTAQLPIDVYFKRKIIDQNEYFAANRLYQDFVKSGQTNNMIINLERLPSEIKCFSEKQLEAREHWRLAINAIPGNIGKLMIINVCCYGFYLSEISCRHYNNSSQAMARLHEALSDLIKHYNKPLDPDHLDR